MLGVEDLICAHQRLCSNKGSCADPVYAIQTQAYITPSPKHLNYQVLMRLVLDGWRNDAAAVEAASAALVDEAFMSDCYQIAQQDAQEEALATMAKVFRESMPPAWRASLEATGGVIRIGYSEKTASGIGSALKSATQAPGQSASLIWNISQALYSIDRAFKAAGIALLSFDFEMHVAGLIQNEVQSELM